MRAYPGCEFHCEIDVYLNGKKVEDAWQADEELGEVVADYRDVTGKRVTELEARPGDLVAEGCKIIILKGEVEIRIAEFSQERLQAFGFSTMEEVRAFIDGTGTPVVIQRVEPYGGD